MHTTTRKLILLRHGESEWHSRNLFTGWVDVDLTPTGRQQAREAGRLLRAAGLRPAAAHTSVLTRAVDTCTLALEAAGCPETTPFTRHWRLNERHYGALQGREKKAVRQEYGEERFLRWRRSYDAAPPPAPPGEEVEPAGDPRCADLGCEGLPRSESLADVIDRILPHWRETVAPGLRPGHPTLLVAHSNSLRALVAHLDGLSREEVLTLNIPVATPLLYELDSNLTPVKRGGRYLDPEAAAAGAAQVADQGR